MNRSVSAGTSTGSLSHDGGLDATTRPDLVTSALGRRESRMTSAR